MRRYFITEVITITRGDLTNILEIALNLGASLHWVLDYTFEDGILRLITVEDIVYHVKREDLMASLRSLQNILGYLVINNEFSTYQIGADSADLILQIALYGELKYD